MGEKRADWKRLSIGQIVSGYDGELHGHYQGPVLKIERRSCVRRNLPDMWLVTVLVDAEFGCTVTKNFTSINEAYGE